ncbi:MAG: hypothetical protein R3314_05470, partial [Longimicrobiales bacterium]|nr:hypothetical protein [Longimicrobiales bacterium]
MAAAAVTGSMRRRPGPALVLVGVLGWLFAAAPADAQAPPPDEDWRTLRTEHFRVTFPPRLEPVARQAAGIAERTHAVLSRELAEPPSPVIDIIVTDHADYSNGLAGPFPSPRVILFARPAAAGEFFARDWLELVVVHELVHIFHLERTSGLGDLAQAVLGRVPMVWPLNPVVSTPTWSTEGLATHYETRLTGAGRVRSSIHDMVIRTAALEGALPALDELSVPSPVWPAGNRAYIYGGHFMAWIARTHGPEAHRAIIDATTGSVWPTFLRFDHVARGAIGEPFDRLYDRWRAEARDSARALAGAVRARGVTETRPVAGRGPYAVAPRVSPDGTRLSFAASDWRSDPVTRIVELGTGETRRLAERNQFGMILDPASWLPDGSGLIVAQLEFQDPYRLFSDLWQVGLDGSETRLTDGLRLAQPDVGPDGRRVAAVQDHRAGMRLVVHDLETGELSAVAGAAPGEAFDRPRWSPDGRWIAAGLHRDGRTDLVLVDARTGALTPLTDDDALDLAPAWSPDGRWLLWWSDRTGAPNIMAVAVAGGRPSGPVRQVTRVLTGAIDPEVDPGGETLYLARYHVDGWRVEATPFEPAAWPEAPAPPERYGDAVLAPVRTGPGAGMEATAYSPWPTLRPFYWLPRVDFMGSTADGSQLRFLGVSLNGTDVVQRHSWQLEAAVDIDTGRLQGGGLWLYRGLGNPDLFIAADRRFVVGPSVELSDGRFEPLVFRDEQLSAGVRLRRSRWRSASVLQLAAELQRQAFEGRALSRAELAAGGIVLSDPRTLVGAAAATGYGTARAYP